MYKVILTFVFIVFMSAFAYSWDIEATGRATVLRDDVRAAQKNSLNNALLAGIRRYMLIHAPHRSGNITEDHIMFIDSYTIIRRNLVENTVITTVRLNINDMIKEDVVDFLANQANTAVFTFSGVPDFVRDSHVRNAIIRELAEKQFSTRNQTRFEQENVDKRSAVSIMSAFRSVSSQYLIDFRFNVRNYRAGESCTMQSSMSYTLAGTTVSVPVLMLEVTVEEDDPAKCLLNAVENATAVSLAHMREAIVPAPRERITLSQYTLTFVNVPDLRTINTIVDSIRRRKLTTSSDMNSFFYDEAVFSVESYLSAANLAERIYGMNMETIKSVDYESNNITITINQGMQ